VLCGWDESSRCSEADPGVKLTVGKCPEGRRLTRAPRSKGAARCRKNGGFAPKRINLVFHVITLMSGGNSRGACQPPLGRGERPSRPGSGPDDDGTNSLHLGPTVVIVLCYISTKAHVDKIPRRISLVGPHRLCELAISPIALRVSSIMVSRSRLATLYISFLAAIGSCSPISRSCLHCVLFAVVGSNLESCCIYI